ncbi:hypothetical protein PWT90_03837 [Aphanocladium album]|nr:hypothetical protein PWT90_03837 [Aphanocladium album]
MVASAISSIVRVIKPQSVPSFFSRYPVAISIAAPDVELALRLIGEDACEENTRERRRALIRHSNPYGDPFAICHCSALPERLPLLASIIEVMWIHDDVTEELDHSSACQQHQLLAEVLRVDIDPLKYKPANVRQQTLARLLQAAIALDNDKASSMVETLRNYLATFDNRDDDFDSMSEYMPYRISNCGYWISSYFIRWGMGMTLTTAEYESIRDYDIAMGNVLGLTNDYFSWNVEKDQPTDRIRNGVRVLSREHNVPPDAAKKMLLGSIIEEEERAATIKKRRIMQPVSESVAMYFDAIELYVGGSCYWHATAPRYQKFDVSAALRCNLASTPLRPKRISSTRDGMGAITPVFNSVVRPVSIAEFREAILSTCKPRFPNVRHARSRPIGEANKLHLARLCADWFPGLAISGGVDSMALAYLFSHYVKTYKSQHITDNPVRDILSVTIDHRLRPESSTEAAKVATNVRHLGLRAEVLRINWSNVLGSDVDPTTQPNMESLARTHRYRVLGSFFAKQNVVSLFFGHHRDDQYETILMRLLSGHGYRGLQGIRQANAIPECYDINGVYKSGLADDQLRVHPYLKFSPPISQTRALRKTLKHESTMPGFEQFRSHLGVHDLSTRFPGQVERDYDASLPYLSPLTVEDGGITIYRPLLEFDKARLVATCEANGVPWFEDGTNLDPTLTTRNALRKLCRENELPKALQKTSILALAERSRRRVQVEENQAARIIQQEATIVDFDPNVGSLLVDLPLLHIGRSMYARINKAARDKARRGRQRLLAAVITRKLLSFVTPDSHLPSISNLENTVRRLFPSLHADEPAFSIGGGDRKGFSIAGVQFDPVPSYNSTRWFLSRAPLSSNYMRAVATDPSSVFKRPSWVSSPNPLPWEEASDPAWKSWKTAVLWDGRFWIRLNSCHRQSRLHVLPLMAEHTRAFKAALNPKDRARFEKLLKYHARGKVRYTLPGIYALQAPIITPGGTGSEEAHRKMMLLALPTLGIHIASLEKWVRYDVRYKHVDTQILGKRKHNKTPRIHRFTTRVSVSRRRRQQRLRMDEEIQI